MSERASRYSDRVQSIEMLLRGGELASARRALRSLADERIPRDHARAFADLARRASLPQLGVRWLNPFVRGTASRFAAPTPRETASYASCLLWIGASFEAERLLTGLIPQQLPLVWRFLAFCRIREWDPEAAVPMLQAFVHAAGVPRYQRSVGKADLIEAYLMAGQHRRVERLLGDLLYETSLRKWFLLQDRVDELAVRALVQRRALAEAQRMLDRAVRLRRGRKGGDTFFIEKWGVILAFLRRPRSAAAVDGLRALSVGAMRRHDWETARLCDRVRAVETRDVPLYQYLYFGTPYEGFREQIEREFGLVALPDDFLRRPPGGGAARATIDLITATVTGLRAGLRFGQADHRLLCALSADFYLPSGVGEIHGRMYPGEHFNPNSSPSRVQNAILRLRRWIARAGAPLAIVKEGALYRLRLKPGAAVRVARDAEAPFKAHAVLGLRGVWGTRPFTLEQARAHLGVSHRTAQRLFSAARSRGWVARDGRGPATRYRFTGKSGK